VIGVNTSAFIEAAIVGRPVHTLLDPAFADTQAGTIHFHDVIGANGGFVTAAADVTTHLDQLARACTNPESSAPDDARFIERFVRPHGREVPSATRLVDAIERLGRETRLHAARTPLRVHAGRLLLFPLAACAELAFLIDKQRARGEDVALRATVWRLLFHPNAGLLRRFPRIRRAAAALRVTAFRLDAFLGTGGRRI
jgi:hypothetical protein